LFVFVVALARSLAQRDIPATATPACDFDEVKVGAMVGHCVLSNRSPPPYALGNTIRTLVRVEDSLGL